MKFSELLEQVEADLVQSDSLTLGDNCNPVLNGVAAVETAQAGMISYIEGDKFAAQVDTTAASALILPVDETLQARATARGIAWVATPEPRLLFALAIAQFYHPYQLAPQIHPTAVIDPSVQLGEQVAIGAHVVIERGVTVGDRVCIFPNTVIYPDCQIGAGTVIHANCTIEERTVIGADCIIHSGAVIGGEGFGFVPRPPQGYVKMNQSGRVILGDRVDVGCNTTIDRPSVGVTQIGNGTKIDNLVQIAHNCTVGDHAVMSSQVGLSGQVTVGNWAILAGQVGVSNQVKIGDGAIATAQAGLHRDVGPKEIVSGSPAIANSLWLKVSAVYSRLPEIYQTLRQLKRAAK
jgi:UDP-3-O-[3-hydroxymyristoyl] glucosamine N-acyltransferase